MPVPNMLYKQLGCSRLCELNQYGKLSNRGIGPW